MRAAMNRREFLRAAALTSFGIMIAACQRPEATPVPPPTEEAKEVQEVKAETAVEPEAPTAAPAGPDYLNLDSELPIAKELVEMEAVCCKNANGGPAESLWYFEFMEKFGNIRYKVTQLEPAGAREQLNLMFASGQMPDVFLQVNFSTSDIVQWGMIDEFFMPLNDLIDAYAPNIKEMFETFPESKAASTTPDGNIYTLPQVNTLMMEGENLEETVPRCFIHRTWLEKLGLKDPETLDELYDVLTAFKERDPNGNGAADEIPFCGAWDVGFDERVPVTTALGFVHNGGLGMTMREGEPTLLATHPLFAEYLKYMNKLWTAGLFDRDMFTQDDVGARAKSSQGLAGLMLDGAPFVLHFEGYQEYEGFIPVTSQWNSEKTWGGYTVVSPGHFAIPKECKYPEAAIRNADLYFIDKWAHHFWIGPKKDSEEALGYPGWYWDDEGATTFDYPEGITNAWDMINCCVNPVCGFFGKYQVAKRYLKEAFDYEAPYDPDSIENTWRESMNKRTTPYCKPRFPTVYLEPEAQERIREIETAMWDYAEPIEARLIVGEEPLTDENLDKYFAEMKTIGAEEYEQIYKDAYEIYLSSLEG